VAALLDKYCYIILIKDFSLHLVKFISTFCHPEPMSDGNVLCSFTRYEPCIKKDTCWWSWMKTDMLVDQRGYYTGVVISP